MEHREFNEDRLLQQAGAALGGAKLERYQVLRGDPRFPSYVLRCRLTGSGTGDRTTVIIKQSNWPGQAIAEWIALEFLNSLPALQQNGPVPELLAADATEEFVVMEDLGQAPLGSLLHTADGSQARHVLLGFARALATLHGATIGWEEQHREIMNRRCGHRRWGTIDDRMNKALGSFPSVAESAGVEVGADAAGELQAVADLLNAPEPFRGLLQGDLNPGNIFYNGHEVRVCDFVPSAYYNIMVEGVYPLIYYLAHGDVARFPDELTEEMLGEYLRVLGTRCTAALDEQITGTHMVAAGAGWMAYILEVLPEFSDEDRNRGVFTYRQSMLHCLGSFSEMATRFGRFPHIRDLAHQLSMTLKARWACDRVMVPLCEAFRTTSGSMFLLRAGPASAKTKS